MLCCHLWYRVPLTKLNRILNMLLIVTRVVYSKTLCALSQESTCTNCLGG